MVKYRSTFARSSNGRTTDSESVYLGSNPSLAAPIEQTVSFRTWIRTHGKIQYQMSQENPSGSSSEFSKYELLHERGVKLSDEDIDFIVDQISLGIQDTYEYLEVQESDRNLGFIASDNLDRIGYAEEQKAINLPVSLLNRIAEAGIPVRELVARVGLTDKREVRYPIYLRNAGREETIHHFQKKGHPMLHVQYAGLKYMTVTETERLLSDFEVEARTMTDEIAKLHGEEPIWAELDSQLREAYGDKYNSPIE